MQEVLVIAAGAVREKQCVRRDPRFIRRGLRTCEGASPSPPTITKGHKMRRIYKYVLCVNDDVQKIEVPGADARIVHTGMQGDDLCVWIEHHVIGRSVVPLRVFGTGHDIPGDAAWRGTVQVPPFVWHVYEV